MRPELVHEQVRERRRDRHPATVDDYLAALRDELSGMLRAITADALSAGGAWSWKSRKGPLLERFRHVLNELRAAESPDLAMLSVAMRELRNLASR